MIDIAVEVVDQRFQLLVQGVEAADLAVEGIDLVLARIVEVDTIPSDLVSEFHLLYLQVLDSGLLRSERGFQQNETTVFMVRHTVGVACRVPEECGWIYKWLERDGWIVGVGGNWGVSWNGRVIGFGCWSVITMRGRIRVMVGGCIGGR